MGTFRITVEIADPRGQRFEAVEMLVDTGATFTKAPRGLLERLGVPVERFYTAELADGSRVERTRGRTSQGLIKRTVDSLILASPLS